jgi:hypothetical protein
MDDGLLGGAGMGPAIDQEQAQSAQNQHDRSKAQADALPGAVVGNSDFVLHLRLLVNVRGTNAAMRGRVSPRKRKILYTFLCHNK